MVQVACPAPPHDDDRQIESALWFARSCPFKELLPEQQLHNLPGLAQHGDAAEIAVHHVGAHYLWGVAVLDNIRFAITNADDLRFKVTIGQNPPPDVAICQRADQTGLSINHEDDFLLGSLQLFHRLSDGMRLGHEERLDVIIH